MLVGMKLADLGVLCMFGRTRARHARKCRTAARHSLGPLCCVCGRGIAPNPTGRGLTVLPRPSI